MRARTEERGGVRARERGNHTQEKSEPWDGQRTHAKELVTEEFVQYPVEFVEDRALLLNYCNVASATVLSRGRRNGRSLAVARGDR